MNRHQPIKITFHFPKISGKSKRVFVEDVLAGIPLDSKIGYAGFLYKKYLRKHLMKRYSCSDIATYQPLALSQKEKIKRILLLTARRSARILPPPAGRVSVFILPWFGPFDGYDKAMGFSTGFCPFKNTILIFLAPRLFARQSLKGSLAHEYNHAVFFNYHHTRLTLLNMLVSEGLAQNFEEEVVNAGPPPYATVLSQKEAARTFDSMSPYSLRSTSYSLYRHVFFGGKKYKKWTGYSIGYWMIKSFKKEMPNLSWQEIMKMEPSKIVGASGFAKK